MSSKQQSSLEHFFESKGSSSSASALPNASLSTKTDGINPILLFLRKLVTCDCMPRVSAEGIPFLAPETSSKRGRDSAKNRTELKSQRELREHLEKAFPNYPVHTPTPSPRERALQHRVGSLEMALESCRLVQNASNKPICGTLAGRHCVRALKRS